MYLGKTLAIAGTACILLNVAHGAWTCYNEFCPGDSETDWVYEYESSEGKRFVVVEGKHIPKEAYKESPQK